jgi:purine nucleosidase
LRIGLITGVLAMVTVDMKGEAAAAAPPTSVIFDTDIENDVDDVGAAAVLHALADQGECRILAMGVSVKHRWSAPCLDVLNTYYGRPDIPIGVVKSGGVETGSKYAETIAKEFPHDLKSPDDAPDAVALYRRILAEQPDGSVVFVSVGFLTNVARLLESQAGGPGELSGVELVRKKVRAWVCMGGKFPDGKEWNVYQDTAASKVAFSTWPTPIVFSGFEIGDSIQTGAALKSTPASPVRRGYELFNGLENRSSWDQTAVLYAVRGLDGGLTQYWDVSKPGVIELAADGSNRWREQADGKHTYLIRKSPDQQIAAAIDRLMTQPPAKPAK